MANINAPFGLAPVRTVGGTWSQQVSTYYIVSTDPNAYYIGDAVLSAASGDANGVPGVIKSTTGTDVLRGVFVGAYPANWNPVSLQGVALALENTYIPATKTRDYYVMVVDDPNVVFAIQGDATATNQVAANCNKNFSLTVAAGATTTSTSGTVVNSGSINTTNSLNMKLMGLQQIPGNGYGAYAKWLCKINLHELSAFGATGV